MRQYLPVPCALLFATFLGLFSPRPALAWGDETHEAVARGAAVAVAEPMRPFFLASTPYLAAHATDPDYIPDRTQAQKAEHFLDLDLFGEPPFAELPHDRKAAEAKFGAGVMAQRGLLPWAVQREYDRMAAALKKKEWAEARLAAAHLSHFVADSTMPLHATSNYDGKLTGNDGIHLRIETELAPRYHSMSHILAGAPVEIGDAAEWAFRTLQESWTHHSALLKAETAARKAAPFDSERYYAELERGCGALLDQRMRLAATAVASFWTAAWKQAGSPALPPETVLIVIEPSRSAMRGMSAETAASLALPPGALNSALRPFDALAYCGSDAPPYMRSFTLQFMAAGDEEALANPLLGHRFGGGMANCLAIAIRAFEQFPRSRRAVVVITAGWPPDPAALDQARLMKERGIRALFIVKGAKDATAQAEELAAQSGGRLLRLAGNLSAHEALRGNLPALLPTLP